MKNINYEDNDLSMFEFNKIDKYISINLKPIIKEISGSNNNINIKLNNIQYHYDEFNDIQNKLIKLHEDIIYYSPFDKNLNIKLITEGITRGVARYINDNFKLNYPISNGFIKLWELYNLVPKLLPIIKNKKNINVFHIAEAPGQWIHTTDYYIYTTLVKNKDSTFKKYNWYANSLNPYNKINIKKYGNDLFKDNYGFIKKYQNRWIYGKDNTGDITNIDNIKWFKKFIEDKPNFNGSNSNKLITSDAGISSDYDMLLMQKLDLSQILMVLTISNKGDNCVIKHFLPFLEKKNITYTSSGLYINMMYLYILSFENIKFIKPSTSNPNSGEFYVLGLNFKGFDNKQLNKLYKFMNNMKINKTFFNKNDIPIKITNQLIDFFKKIYELNYNQKKIIKILVKCLYITNKYIYNDKNYKKCQHICDNFLNKYSIKKINDKKILYWINKFNFN